VTIGDCIGASSDSESVFLSPPSMSHPTIGLQQRSTAAILRVVDAAIADRKAGETRPALGESDLLDMMLSVWHNPPR
jgi:hypothetical protein